MKKNTKAFSRRGVLLLASLVLIFGLAVTGSVAVLKTMTDPVVNTFEVMEVPNEVVEEFNPDKTLKENVRLKNTSTKARAYLRAAVIISWVKADANGSSAGEIYATVPVEGTDYTIAFASGTGWVKGSDGYYYYTAPVAANTETAALIASCQRINIDSTTKLSPNQPRGYTLSVEILGQSIQADGQDDTGAKPVVLAWGQERGGSVLSVSSVNGALSIDEAE